MNKLKSCPFCGNAPRLGQWATDYVKCDDCGVEIIGVTPERAIAAWNRRADPLVEELRGALEEMTEACDYAPENSDEHQARIDRAREALALPVGGGSSREPALSDDGGDECSLATETPALRLVCEKCGRFTDYDRSIDPGIPRWVVTLSQSHCDADGCDTGDRLIETWLDADGVARDPAESGADSPSEASAGNLPPDEPILPLPHPDTSRHVDGAEENARLRQALQELDAVLGDTPMPNCATMNRLIKASANARAALSHPEGQSALVEAARAMADDYQTSPKHHPQHVLVPLAAFEAMRAALAQPDPLTRGPQPAAALWLGATTCFGCRQKL